MADRIPQYPMYSQGVMQNSVQQPTQSQMQQQPQQPQQPDPQMIQGLSNTDLRMWQQMQMQNYRAQQSGDLAASQLNQQASIKRSLSPLSLQNRFSSLVVFAVPCVFHPFSLSRLFFVLVSVAQALPLVTFSNPFVQL